MHVFVNAAVSADGKLSTRERTPVALSGSTDCARVHHLRDQADAILVGSGTVRADDPQLTAREAVIDEQDAELSNPLRVIVDSRATLPADAQVFDGAARTFVFVSEESTVQRRMALRQTGATVIVSGRGRVDLEEVIEALDAYGVDSLMIEGGGEIIASAFQNRLVDDLYTFVAPRILGGCEAPTLVDGDGFVDERPRLERVEVEPLDDGVLIHWRVTEYP